MAVLNVRQPGGGVALFNTISDRFVSFNAEPRGCADYIEWRDALDAALGRDMEVGADVRQAIALGLVSEAACGDVLDQWDKEGR